MNMEHANDPDIFKMEKLGFVKQNKTKMFQYTFLDEPVEDYSYILTKEQWLSLNKQKCKR